MPPNASGEGPLGKKLTANKRNHNNGGKNTRPKKKKKINKIKRNRAVRAKVTPVTQRPATWMISTITTRT